MMTQIPFFRCLSTENAVSIRPNHHVESLQIGGFKPFFTVLKHHRTRGNAYVKLHLDVCYRTMREAAFDGDRGESISLAIVDNDAITLYALRKLIENTPTLTILWTSETGQEALTHCKNKHLPDVLLVDMALSDMPGTMLCRQLRATGPTPSILAFTSYPLDMYAADAAQAGVQGIITKNDFMTLAKAVRSVHEDGVFPYTSQEDVIFETAEAAYDRISSMPSDPAATLTLSEITALNLTARGMSSKEVAKQMGVKPATVRTYTMRARSKLGTTTLGEALVKWQRAKHV